ncbi:uncharacterized protein DUF3324 [Gillisia sp. Hel_I_86]|uniref:DUF3324 domain-containing protein n=1 Tax=Gillisia sp. Hel_I_86 TaxID=1249981 RepID=UPI0011991723|nr:DUF3324 domain-containing protein [Gillisia sp. Hel_I_86]TVZ27839.1 uncharacterized protein DUF3324 [Gillisia sp. Hel_I_86]
MRHVFFTSVLLLLIVNQSYSSVVIINGLTHVYSGSSGDQLQGEIILLNTTEFEQRVSFKLNDAIFSCDSDRFFSEKISHSQSSNTWFDGSLTDKVLAPKEKYVYRFSINIPKDPTLRGSFWTALMLDIEKPIKEERLTQNIDLDTKIRYAVGLLTNVNNYSEVNLDFQKLDLEQNTNTGGKSLFIKLINESLFIEGVKLSLEVYNQNGEKVLETSTKRNMVFPGFCKKYDIDISQLEKGDYECILIANARKEFVGTNVSLTIN